MLKDTNIQSEDRTLRTISDYFDHFGDSWRLPYARKRESWDSYATIRLREKYALEFIADEPKGTAADLGCGIGHGLIQMKQMGFRRVIGVLQRFTVIYPVHTPAGGYWFRGGQAARTT